MAVEVYNCHLAITLVLSCNMLAEDAMPTRKASFQGLLESRGGPCLPGDFGFETLCTPVIDPTEFSPCLKASSGTLLEVDAM